MRQLSFIEFPRFRAKWVGLGLTDEDLDALQQSLQARPEAGAVQKGAGGVRKVRFAPPTWNRGKRGATRVCYVHVSEGGVIGLLAVFAKNEQANLSDADKRILRKLCDAFIREVGTGR